MAHRGRHGADEALACALAQGQNVRAAAQTVGVSEQTIWRRLRNPEFRARVAELRANMVSAATGALCHVMSEAADVLRTLLGASGPDGEPRSEKIRLAAAAKLVELGCKLHESADLEQRIAELERGREGAAPVPPAPPDVGTPEAGAATAGAERIGNEGGEE